MATNLLQLGNYVQQGFDDGRQQGLERRYNRLAGEAFNAPDTATRDAAVGQIAVNNPAAATALRGQFQEQDDRNTRLLTNMARYMKGALDSKNDRAIAGAWKAIRPALIKSRLATEQEISPNWDPSYEQTVHQLLAMGEGAAGAAPTDVRSFQMMTQGLSPEDREKARRINLGLDGRTSSAAIGYQKITGPDGREYLVATDPRQIGSQIVGDGTGYGSFGNQGGTAPQQSGNGFTDVGDGVGRVRFNVTDFTPEQQARVAQTVSMMQQAGYPEDEIERFVLSQMPQNVTNIGAPRNGGNPFSSRRPEDTAAATERAKLQAQQDYLPAELQMRTQADIEKARGVEQAKSEQERASNERAKTAQLNNVDRGLSRIDAALGKLGGTLVDTGPIDGYLIAGTEAGQELERAVNAIQNDMLALTRVPGIGSQSDLEARIASQKYPSIYNHPSVNKANVEQLKSFMADLRRQITGQAGQGAAPASGAARPQTEQDFNVLPSGTLYIDPDDGRTYRKR